MQTIARHALIIATVAILTGCNSLPKSEAPSAAFDLPRTSWADSSAFLPLVKAADRSQVVQLGESIHLTREMPLVRIGALKALNEQGQFDVLAIEGSALDSWLAMDVLLSESTMANHLREAQRRAFFGLWQTDEMRTVLKAVADSLATDHPIYLTSFDSQVGMSVAWRKRNVLESLADTMINYGLKAKRATVIKTFEPLEGLKLCFQSGFPRSQLAEAKAASAISRLETLIEEIRPEVERRSVMHARALMLLPFNLRNNLDLCKAKAHADPTKPWRVYQETRDKQNAENILAIASKISAHGKVIAWAHHSHVHHNSLGTAVPSMGQHLREKLGDLLYTVGVFAIAGEVLTGQEEPELQKVKDGPDIELNSVFRSLSKQDFYVDLKACSTEDLRYSAFFRPATVQTENVIHRAVLARDFDGVIVLQIVTAPKLEF